MQRLCSCVSTTYLGRRATTRAGSAKRAQFRILLLDSWHQPSFDPFVLTHVEQLGVVANPGLLGYSGRTGVYTFSRMLNRTFACHIVFTLGVRLGAQLAE